MMITLAFLVLCILGAYAAPEICDMKMCNNWRVYGLTHDHYCDITDENLLFTFPPGLVTSAHQCELFSTDSDAATWYNFRKSGACELLSFCQDAVKEEGSVMGPDPGKGESCLPDEPKTEAPTTTDEPTTADPTTSASVTTPSPQEVVLVIGGLTNSAIINTIDIIMEDLKVISGAVPGVPVPNEEWTAELIDDQVVVCGGQLYSSDCQHLNLTSRVWTTSSKMVAAHEAASSVVHNGSMYMFGGGTNSVERYDSAFNGWLTVSEWTMTESNTFFCAVEHDDYIYHIGGSISSGMKRLSTITNSYETMPSMQTARQGHKCVKTKINGGHGILVAGGYGGSYLSSTEFYNFGTQKWQSLANMNTGRAYHGLSIINCRPVVFGGYGSRNLDSLEVYDDSQDKWLIVEDSQLPQPIHDFAFVRVPWREH